MQIQYCGGNRQLLMEGFPIEYFTELIDLVDMKTNQTFIHI